VERLPRGERGAVWFDIRVYVPAPTVVLPTTVAGRLARRLLADYPQRPEISVDDLADKYNASRRTMERAVALLVEHAGWK
jgi:hypothetical protein